MTFAHSIKKVARRVGIHLSRYSPLSECDAAFVWHAKYLNAETILDIGGNIGQTGTRMRLEGWTGPIVSFEPLPQAYQKLIGVAGNDPSWHVAPMVALGESEGIAEFNVSSNLSSSSLLPMEDRSIEAAPVSRYESKVDVRVAPLDSVMIPEWRPPYAIKIDTQGFELPVLRGAARTIEQAVLIKLEMSLTPVYKGGASFDEVYAYMKAHGWRCIGFFEIFTDPVRMEMLQVDGLFVRDV